MKKVFKVFTAASLFVCLCVIVASSAMQLIKNKEAIVINLKKLGFQTYDSHLEVRYLVNLLERSERQAPPDKLENLVLNGGEEKTGMFSAPFDWPVIAIHSVLLPNKKVLSFGSYSVVEKEADKDIRENKNIVLSDGLELERDKGSYQWLHHDVQGGVDFDIWDPEKGISEDSHVIFKRPLIVDAFCSVVRVLDEKRVFILGGNPEPKDNAQDTQTATSIFNIETNEFYRGEDLNFARWYGSLVRTNDDRFIMVGGVEKKELNYSVIQEIFESDSFGNYRWRNLPNAKSIEFFGDEDGHEWSYPKAFLSSGGDIFGISYNKMWKMVSNKDFEISSLGEIELASGAIQTIKTEKNPNYPGRERSLQLLTVGAGVGRNASVVMIGKDQLYSFGGWQEDPGYAPSNHVNRIDFSDIDNPTAETVGYMNSPRSDGNAVILPTGEVFINGGHSLNDLEFSVLTAEIFDPFTNEVRQMDSSHFRRNYHSSSLLLPNGTVLTAGGDVWNAEIFYPPYLFTKNANDETVLAERPALTVGETIIFGRESFKVSVDDAGSVSRMTLLSTGSVTHAQGSEPKFRELSFTKLDNETIEVHLPNNRNEVQNGSYLLFSLNRENVPSEGEILILK